MNTQRGLRLWMCVAAIALATGCACADVEVSASLSRQTVAVGGATQLTIQVNGQVAGVSGPALPEIDGLEIVSSGRSQNMSYVNGQMTSSVQYTYVVQAIRAGSYTIPPISVTAGGKTLTTQMLTLTVTGGAGAPNHAPPPDQPPASPDQNYEELFVTTEVDNERPYVGQQIILTMSFFQRAGVRLADSPSYTPAETEGLVAEAMPDPPNDTIVLAGSEYSVIRRRTALLAPAAGKYRIEPVTISYTRNFFDPERTIQSEPIVIEAKPLPTRNQPADFCGLVGEMTAGLTVDRSATSAGESLTARVTATGIGDMRRIEAPELSASGGCKVYPGGGQPSVGPRASGDRQVLGGTAWFEYLLVPHEAGTVTVGPVTMSYFDPDAEQYRRATTESAQVTISQGAVVAPLVQDTPGDELRYIKPTGGGLHERQPVTSSLWFWLAQLLPLVWLATTLRARAEDSRRERDPQYRRFVEAGSRARANLSNATGSGKSAWEAADHALTRYVADKTFAAASSVSPASAEEALVAAGASDELAARVGRTLGRMRGGRFAPGADASAPDEELLDEARELIDELERALVWGNDGRRGA